LVIGQAGRHKRRSALVKLPTRHGCSQDKRTSLSGSQRPVSRRDKHRSAAGLRAWPAGVQQL